MTNIVIDPVTRIEGHLRIEAELDIDGKTIKQAYSSSTMARGIEIIMQGRDPRDACHISQRICGVCTVVHGLTSVRAVEDALNVNVPVNAELIRNLMIGAQYVHDHVMHFYHLHALDWIDVESAMLADTSATAALAMSNNPQYYVNDSLATLKTKFDGVKAKLVSLRDNRGAGGQLGLFANGYWGHPEYQRVPAEGNLLAVAHYLDALGWAREVVKLHTIFGGKDPHPNLVVGGVPCSVSSNYNQQVSEDNGGTSLNKVNMALVTTIITKMKDFVNNVYVPDTVLIASLYKSDGGYVGWEKRGETGGNFLCYGEFPEKGIRSPLNFLIPQGAILNGLKGSLTIKPLHMSDTNEIKEYVAHSWYSYDGGDLNGLHPSIGQTNLNYALRGGPIPDDPHYALKTDEGYSWIKSPRWSSHPMEVGPLAHVVMMYAKATLSPSATVAGKAQKQAKQLVDDIWVSKLGLDIKDIDSTLGRIAARTIETKVIADAMSRWHNSLLSNINAGNLATFLTDAAVVASNSQNSISAPAKKLAAGFKWTDPSTWKRADGKPLIGVGFTEAPRGALGHWLSIEGGKIKNYQCIVASQWNAGPRDASGVPGPYEKSLEGHTLAIPTQPLEILRTIHSFDPCIGCAVHVTDPNGEELIKVNVSTTLR
jgi:hydrogenase large subunit